MKESIGNLWLVGFMITFIFLFVAYLLVTIDYNRTYKMKNEILTIIEKKHGVTDYVGTSAPSKIQAGATVTINSGSLQTINAFLSSNAYDIRGKCPENDSGTIWYGVSELRTRASVNPEVANPNTNYLYCYAKYTIKNVKTYYRVRIFFRMDVPVLGDLLRYDVDGTTNVIPNLDPGALPIS